MTKRQAATGTAPAGGHTIAVVANRTGLSRDVLRVWERRYQVVEPRRSAGGQRLYTDAELARFQLLAQAVRHGRSIGSVAGLSEGELERMVASDQTASRATKQEPAPLPVDRAPADVRHVIQRALDHTLALDSARLDAELRWATARFGLSAMLEEVVPALMYRIGEEWMAERLGIPHEHLASGVVLSILLDAIRTIPERPGAPRLIVATPSGEQHVIGAALIGAAAAVDGWSIVFLGADVPASDLATAARERGARAVALSIVRAIDIERMLEEVRRARAALSADVALIVGGSAALRVADALAQTGAIVCRDIKEARSAFTRIAAAN